MLNNIKIKSMDIKTLRKILYKKGFLLSKKSTIKKQTSLVNLYKISFASLIIISFFYVLPPSYKYVNKKLQPTLEIENSSNQKLTQVLEGKILDENDFGGDGNDSTDQDLVYQELYGEVTEEDTLETGVSVGLQ